MWRFFGVLSLFLLSCIVEAEFPPCEDDYVCVNFVTDMCDVNGKKTTPDHAMGIMWDESTYCQGGDFTSSYATLRIKPYSLRKWSVTVTNWGSYYITEILFDFGISKTKSTLEFRDAGATYNAIFSWTTVEPIGNGTNATMKTVNHKTDIPMLTNAVIETGTARWNHNKYTFDLYADGEKLFDLVGTSDIQYMHPDGKPYSANLIDERFAERLGEQSCDFAEIRKGCIGGDCDDLSNGKTVVDCSSKLWVYKPAEDPHRRQWKEMDNIKCKLGHWEGTLAGTTGVKKVDASHTVQCSAHMPGKLTAKTVMWIGLGIGGGVLVLALMVAVFVVLYRRKKANANNKDTFRGGSNSKAGTPSKRWDLSNSKAEVGTPNFSNSKAGTPI